MFVSSSSRYVMSPNRGERVMMILVIIGTFYEALRKC